MSGGDHLSPDQFRGSGSQLIEDDNEIFKQDTTEGESEGLKNPDRHESYFR